MKLINIGFGEPLNRSTDIVINRVEVVEEVQLETIDYATEYQESDNYVIGYSEVLVDGEKPGKSSKAKVAFLPEKTYLPTYMIAKEAITYIADFYDDFDKEKAMRLMEVFQLNPKQKVKTMSKGQQEKLPLILVMCRNARIYILDEPMGGVDPAARDFILETILQNRPEGSTILMSTHLIQDVEGIFDSILMIRQGKIRIQDSVDNLTKDGKTINDIFKEVFSVDWKY